MTNFPPDDKYSRPLPIADAHRIPAAEQRRRRFAAIWLIPIVAALITLYLGARSYSSHGPLVTISFKTAEGLNAGQTQVKYKAVTLGTVEEIVLKPDGSGVEVRVRMVSAAEPMLTTQARFWVVRARLNAANLSSLSTLVSGTYIQLDPGKSAGVKSDSFTGFDNPPDITPDENGTLYVLKANSLGAINNGSGVYYRDMEVGQVISINADNGFDPISMTVFIRAPYDKFVRADSRFWSASGLSIKGTGDGFQVQLQSFQALMIGGVAFETPSYAESESQAPAKSEYVFYHTHQESIATSNAKHLDFVTYMHSSVHDLAAGSPVEIYGIPVGHVSDVRLTADQQQNQPLVRIAFDIDMEQALGNHPSTEIIDYPAMMEHMVQSGMRVRVESSNLVIGQQIVSLEFVPQNDGASSSKQLPRENGALVLPSESGGLNGLTDALGDVVNKLNHIPFEAIGANLNHLMATADRTMSGSDLQGAIHSLALTMANARDLSATAKENATPALERLPDISAQLQQAVEHANEFLGSVDNSFGAHSDFNRDARRVLEQADDAARSTRLLADYLQRHPEALLQGKTLSPGQPAGYNADAPHP